MGFAAHPSKFLESVCDQYGIELIHLKPSTIACLSIFAFFCEAWLGVRPDVRLWRFFYVPKHFREKMIVWSIDFEPRPAQQFLPGDIRKSWEGFESKWFVVTLAAESSVKKGSILPWLKPGVQDLPTMAPRFKNMMERTDQVRGTGLTAAHVAETFIRWRLAPLKERDPEVFHYRGPTDPNRENSAGMSYLCFPVSYHDLSRTSHFRNLSFRFVGGGGDDPVGLFFRPSHEACVGWDPRTFLRVESGSLGKNESQPLLVIHL